VGGWGVGGVGGGGGCGGGGGGMVGGGWGWGWGVCGGGVGGRWGQNPAAVLPPPLAAACLVEVRGFLAAVVVPIIFFVLGGPQAP